MSQAAASGVVYGIIFVDIPSMTAQLLGMFLQNHETLSLVGQAQGSVELQRLLRTETPRVALVYIRSNKDGTVDLSALQYLRAQDPLIRPVILGDRLTSETETALLYEGARGLLREAEVDLATLVKCMCSVAAGQVWASSGQLEQLLTSLSRPRTLRITNVLGDTILSRREEEVLQLLSEGLSNRDLAVTLGLSEHTVKNHLFRIFDKLGVSNRMEAILYAISRRETATPSVTVPTSQIVPIMSPGVQKIVLT